MIRRLSCLLVLSAVTVAAPAAFAQMLAPATAPATAPSTRPTIAADQTTPQGTLILFAKAIQEGDVPAVRGIFHATNPQESMLADFFSQRTKVSADFRSALASKFGEEAATRLTNSSNDDVTIAAQHISDAEVKVDGDKATVQMRSDFPGAPAPDAIELVRAEGKWKVPMQAMTEGLTPDKIDENVKMLKTLQEVIVKMTGEVEQGKFTKIEEVVDALNSRLQSAALEAGPTSGPTTAPGMP
jgi:hypothetical protein